MEGGGGGAGTPKDTMVIKISNWVLKEKIFPLKEAIFGPKMTYRHNSGSTSRIFFKCCTMKGAKKCMKII